MNEKVMIRATKESNLLMAIMDYMEKEKIEYAVDSSLKEYKKDYKKIIYIVNDGEESIEIEDRKGLSFVVISSKKKIISTKSTINYLITNLVTDRTNYTDVQKEYLFKKGIYRIFIEKLGELLENENQYDGMIYDLTELKTIPNNWIFHFDSINDTYSWLSKKNAMLPSDFTRKVLNFYDVKVYDDSLREINYLTEKLMEIKEGKRVIDIFICTKEELELFKKNYFFKLLIKNISSTYRFYLVDKERLMRDDNELMEKLMDGIAIYNDCVYRDTYDDEFSLGYVDCNLETIEIYNQYFDYVLEKYGREIKVESDLNEF